MTTTVVNIRSGVPYDVYIGRPGQWGNPFKIGHRNPGDGHVWTRDEVIGLYRSWLRDDPELVAAARVELKGKILGCFCTPLPCHGDVLAAIAEGEDP